MEQLEGWVIQRLVVGGKTTSTGGEVQLCEEIVYTNRESGIDEEGLGDGKMCIGMHTIMLFQWKSPFFHLVVAAQQCWAIHSFPSN